MLSLFTVGYFCTVLSTRLSRNIYESKKTNLERILKRNFNKNFDLGEFSDLRFLGFSVLKTKIEETFDKCNKIREYALTQLKKVSLEFNQMVPVLNKDFTTRNIKLK